MQNGSPRIDEIRYNAAEECFEALVTLNTIEGAMRIASAYPAPVTAEFEEVSNGLLRNALRNRTAPEALRSRAPSTPPRRHLPHSMPFAA
ncbi:hypothetical protein JYP51_05395 [Ponticoccus gilvus]|nr:hypothetical protein [Enemella evansiae]